MTIQELKKISQNFSLLYVEDDEHIASMFNTYLNNLFKTVYSANNGEEGLKLYQKYTPDMVITDIQMPIMDGLKMSKEIKEFNPEQFIIIISAFSDVDKLYESIHIGIDGYILKPINYEFLNQTLYNNLTKLKKIKEHELYEKSIHSLLHQKSTENLQLELEKIQNYEQTLYALIDIIESRDTYTGKHSVRVARYSKAIAQELQMSKIDCDEIYRAAMLHDLGKIGIPDTLLLKPGKLNLQEFNLIKQHVNIGFHMLNQIPMFKNIAQMINEHHERCDGSGYPNGLTENKISIGAAILAVSDTFDAMTTNRIYKHRKNVQEALHEIETLKGIHYKKEVVEAALVALQNICIDESINQLPHSTLEEERFSFFYKDALCQVYNDTYLDFVLAKNMYEPEFDYLNLVKLRHFGAYNKKEGWSEGNKILQHVGAELKALFPKHMIFRVHGDDFIILSSHDKRFDNTQIETLQQVLQSTPISIEVETFSIQETHIDSLNSLEKLI